MCRIRFVFLALLALFLLLFATCSCYFGPKIVFYGAHFGNTRGLTVADATPDMQPVSFTTEDGNTLRGWLLNRGKGAPLVIAYGGNNMNVGDFAGLSALCIVFFGLRENIN